MKKSSKTKVKVLVFALALLLCLALSIGVAGAWYQANRTATGTLNMDTGIKIEYTGFHQEVADSDTIWQKDDVEFNLFSTTSVVPGTEIVLEPNTTINAATGSVDFYARFKLDYKFYTDLAGTAEATGINPTDVLVPSDSFINSAWVESQNGDGFYYLATGTTLDVLTPGGTPAAFFADGAKYTINTNIGGEGFGYQVDADTTIVRADVILTLEVAQVGTPWSVTPLPVVEDLSTNVLQDTSGNVVTDVVSGTTYQIVDKSNNGLKYTFTLNETTPLNASTLSSGVSNLSSVVVDPSDVDGTATVTGYTGEITDVVIPDYVVVNGKTYEVTNIKTGAFARAKNLTNVTIPNNITSIGIAVFNSCVSLDKFIANGTYTTSDNGNLLLRGTEIVAFAPYGITEYTIPDGVTGIGESVFTDMTSLTSITIPDGVTSIGERAFSSCQGLISATIGNEVISIGEYAFSNCILLKSIEIPNSVKNLGAYAFQYCEKLESVTIGDGLTGIGDRSFQGCNSLTDVAIGKSVNSLGERAFNGCANLTEMTIEAITPPSTANKAAPSYLETIYVPSEAVDTYKADATWGTYNIKPIA